VDAACRCATPGEAPGTAAAREVEEEIGLVLWLTPVPEASASENVALYAAEAPLNAEVLLDEEHDRFLWLPLAEALP
jgi:8-oxo-dGTP pyrophosphatase MutT (NUDIX family)